MRDFGCFWYLFLWGVNVTGVRREVLEKGPPFYTRQRPQKTRIFNPWPTLAPGFVISLLDFVCSDFHLLVFSKPSLGKTIQLTNIFEKA